MKSKSSSPILWGAWINDVYGTGGNGPWSAATVARFTEHAGKKPSVEHWGQPWGALDLNALNLVKGRGALSMVDCGIGSTNLADIAAGKQDAVIDAFAQKCKTFGGRMFLRPWWEMNGTWYSWGRSPSYVAAWRRFHDRVKAVAPLVEFVWCPNTIWDAASDPAPWYPGDAYVDWVGVDGYNAAALKKTTWKSPYELFKSTYDRLRQIGPGKPIAICETASTEGGGSKAAWITNLLGTALRERFTEVEMMLWFNWDILEEGTRRDWPIESSPEAQAAFKSGISSSYYRAAA